MSSESDFKSFTNLCITDGFLQSSEHGHMLALDVRHWNRKEHSKSSGSLNLEKGPWFWQNFVRSFIKKKHLSKYWAVSFSVVDPDPNSDPYIFGPPGSGSVSIS